MNFISQKTKPILMIKDIHVIFVLVILFNILNGNITFKLIKIQILILII